MLTPKDFVARWQGSAGDERANKDSFLRDFCAALGLDAPGPKDTSPGYCFEKEIRLTHADGTTTGFMDLYREGCFVLEAKQGGKVGSPNARGTRSHERYLERAFWQAVRYAQALPKRPPFLITCDIGHLFEVWEGFTGDYGGYARRWTVRLEDLLQDEVQARFRAIWNDPQSLDPARRRARVTRDVAQTLGTLAKGLEGRFPSEAIARFLMRCVFTFFAEDTGLLPADEFQAALEEWRRDPKEFPAGLEALWDAMNEGGRWGRKKLLRFNGSLFAESLALDLDAKEIELLHQAARFDWAEVDPSIFGTLLESALDPAERHRLGAHYTPRAFVERLLKPSLEEPLRRDWELAQAEAFSHLSESPTDQEKAKAREVLHRFQHDLAHVRVLDPACGSGNFLAAAYDALKRIEGEVQRRLQDLGETETRLALEGQVVTPRQFMGIEVKPWAAAIADLVLWIGHLQWHRKLHPGHTPPEPVLQAYGNIECRDAVLAWKGTKPTGRTRWDGKTFKKHPVTGKDVPDETAQIEIEELIEPRQAAWPEAEFIVGNPPFLGNKRMREALGDGYVEALRSVYKDVPDSVDFVLYWWHRAAEAVRHGEARRFGLITTNSLTQTFNRRVVSHATNGKSPLKLIFAIPDHPWHDMGAAVRISMTVGTGSDDSAEPWLIRVLLEGSGLTPEMEAEAVVVKGLRVDRINEDLSGGADVANAQVLRSNDRLSSRGMKPVGAGFLTDEDTWTKWGKPSLCRRFYNGRDLTDVPRGALAIDTFGLTLEQLRTNFPEICQHLFDRVKPERDQMKDEAAKRKWWLFERNRPELRDALAGISKFIVTPYTSKHRVFQLLETDSLPDDMLVAIASEDAFHLGVLSSRLHVIWAAAAGTRLGVGNDLRYNNANCFGAFPFPDATPAQQSRIRELAETLDAHRKAAQGRGVTITQMYNLRAKLKAGEAFTEKERELHGRAQTSILAQLHDDLDAAVAEAYGWPADLSDEQILERLVALNKERAEEEKRGLIRWLRPEYQAKAAAPVAEAPRLVPAEEAEEIAAVAAPAAAGPAEARPWPSDRRAQFAALRDLLLSAPRLWTLEDLAKAFKSRGRYRDSIQAHLGVLEDLGLVERLDASDGPRWHRPSAAAG
ncbi:MAG: type IIL restriction-modification enzyme MmeI [Holophagaceae bacterium]